MSEPGRGKMLLVAGLVLALLTALIVWIARHTYWDDESIPTPLRGEAARNPFYAAQRFAQSLGATAESSHALSGSPARDSVIVITAWHWDLNAARRATLERWVENGGRLVVDRTLITTQEEFEHWSGIEVATETPEEDEEDDAEEEDDSAPEDSADYDEPRCRPLEPAGYSVCGLDRFSKLRTSRKVAWSLSDEQGMQAIRVNIGRGNVTVVNANPFVYRRFLEGDHPRLFVAATQLRRGDIVQFLTEDHHPGLLALLWKAGSPAIALALTFIALALWRKSVRFGPPLTPLPQARRSLGEQIRGTGQFILRLNDGAALHAAVVRALNDTAERRISGYARLAHGVRAQRLAEVTGYDAAALAAALGFTGRYRSPDFRNALVLLESAQRRILLQTRR